MSRTTTPGSRGSDTRGDRQQPGTATSTSQRERTFESAPILRRTRWHLRVLAALIWYGSGALLLTAGALLLAAAAARRADLGPLLLSFCGAGLLGVGLARCVLYPVCTSNLARIDQLDAPGVWQALSPRTCGTFGAVILIGIGIPFIAEFDYAMLLAFGALDFGLATALFGSGIAFWDAPIPACPLRGQRTTGGREKREDVRT